MASGGKADADMPPAEELEGRGEARGSRDLRDGRRGVFDLGINLWPRGNNSTGIKLTGSVQIYSTPVYQCAR